MPIFLDEILDHKRAEVAAAKAMVEPREMGELLAAAPPTRGFAAALRRAAGGGRLGLIAEIKKASPSAGVIQHDFDPLRQATEYARAEADALSILTDERYFQGHLDYLRDVRQAVGLPVLRKDFIIDPFQIVEARAAGADAVLLIAAALTAAQLGEFHAQAHALGMDALVEAHTDAELDTALALGAPLIGINSRDLRTMRVDLAVIERLAARAAREAPGALIVGESGIRTGGDARRLRAAGVGAILVGETLMRAASVGEAAADLVRG